MAGKKNHTVLFVANFPEKVGRKTRFLLISMAFPISDLGMCLLWQRQVALQITFLHVQSSVIAWPVGNAQLSHGLYPTTPLSFSPFSSLKDHHPTCGSRGRMGGDSDPEASRAVWPLWHYKPLLQGACTLVAPTVGINTSIVPATNRQQCRRRWLVIWH